MEIRRSIILNLILALLILAGLSGRGSAVQAQEPEPKFSPQVEAMFEKLSVEERVGQLFVATFTGTDVSTNSVIAQLVRDYRIGGVWLQPANKPLTADEQIPGAMLQNTVNQLQTLAFEQRLPASLPISDTETISTTQLLTASIPIPLFIAAENNGNGFPHSIASPELPEFPSGMALGATWKPENAYETGVIAGRQASVLGVNMLFGPVLDVMDNPSAGTPATNSVLAFGGDPYWVSRMGRAFIRGVHTGSENSVLTIASHFPGAGSIDRELNQDIPTIQKTLSQLQLVELSPFYAVTAPDVPDPQEITDGLMTAHIRYRGLQGNIRDLTKPISLDPQNMPQILETLTPWRNSGGLVVSGPLEVPAVTKTYKVAGDEFPARRIALDAFLAGSDVLLFADLGITGNNQTQFENISSAIDFFVEKYGTDTVFQQRVDESVKRILQAKFSLYPNMRLNEILRTPEQLSEHQTTPETLFDIVRNGVTLVYPDVNELADRIPSPPLRDESIVIFSDDRQAQQCDACPAFSIIPSEALQTAILDRYGPDASDQITAGQIHSYTFTELMDALQQNPDTLARNQNIIGVLEKASWVIFAMLDVDPVRHPSSMAVKTFLRQSSIDMRDKKVIVLSFDAPTYLDNTEVSILTAYYGFYNKTPQHIEAAARLLFKEFSPVGHSPVNVDAVEYKIPNLLEPDPEQVILLEYTQTTPQETPTPEASPTVEATIEGTPQPVAVSIGVGDQLVIRTGVIVDRLGNPVPDNTLVSFNRTYSQEGLALAPITVPTLNGIAQTTITVDREGTLEITASSGEATRSGKIVIEGPTITIETPTATATATPTDTPTPTLTPTPVPSETPAPTDTPVPTATPVIVPVPEETQPTLVFRDLIFSVAALLAIAGVIVRFSSAPHMPLAHRAYPALMAVAVGLAGYVLYGIFAVQLAGAAVIGDWVLQNTRHHWLTPIISAIFALAGWGAVIFGRRMRARWNNR